MSLLKNSLVLFFVVLCACGKPLYNCLWQDVPVNADGKANEWSVPLSYYDGESKLQYSFSNDRNNIYACIKVSDPQAQMKILYGGMTFAIDTTGKNKKQISIDYPIGNAENISKEEQSPNYRPDVSSLKRFFSDQPSQMLLTGFKSPLGGLTSTRDSSGLNVSVSWDSVNTMVYEAVIPFKTFYKKIRYCSAQN